MAGATSLCMRGAGAAGPENNPFMGRCGMPKGTVIEHIDGRGAVVAPAMRAMMGRREPWHPWRRCGRDDRAPTTNDVVDAHGAALGYTERRGGALALATLTKPWAMRTA
jgi:hypothetical protein